MTLHRTVALFLVAISTIATPLLGAQTAPAFYIRLDPAPATDDLRERERKTVVPEATYWSNLQKSGKIILFGAAKDHDHTFTMAIVHAASGSEARALAQAAPSVQAGIDTAQVLPFSVFLTSASTLP